jgi:hypothetical protein
MGTAVLYDCSPSEVTDMPRYYFDVWEGNSHVIDSDGTELADAAAAQHEVRRVITEMGRHALKDSTANELRIIVRDTFKTILQARLSLHIERAN